MVIMYIIITKINGKAVSRGDCQASPLLNTISEIKND